MGIFDRILHPLHPRLADLSTLRQALVLTGLTGLTGISAVSLVVNYRTYIRPHLEGLGQRVTEATSPPISQYDTTPPPRPSRTGGYVATMREQPKAYATPDAQESLLQREIMLARGEVEELSHRRAVLEAKVDLLQRRIRYFADKAAREKEQEEKDA